MIERVILTTGGTGGHIFPALAVAEELRRRNPDVRILFVGGRYGRESQFAQDAGLDFIGLPVRGILGRGIKAVGALAVMSGAVLRALGILGRFGPQAVIGFGGYACFAPVLAARLRGVPCAVHEQNSVPGAANRFLSRFTKRVFVSFPDERGAFAPEKTVETGNPVREVIRGLADKTVEEAGTRRVLVVGGSLGARALNDAVIASLPHLREKGIELWHQTGDADYERVKSALEGDGAGLFRVEPFIRDMREAYDWADIVLCRSGATTVAELAVAGKPSILVPFPHATHDHQTVNAGFLDKAGAAVLLPQAELEGTDLAARLDDIFQEPGRLARMSEAARALGAPQAAGKLVDEIEAMINA